MRIARSAPVAVLAAVLVVELVAVSIHWRRVVGGVPAAAEPPAFLRDDALGDAEALRSIRALARAPRTADDWYRLTEALLATGLFREAEHAAAQSLRLRPGDERLLFVHGFALERLGLIDEANERYRQAIAAGGPRTDDYRYFLARNHLRLERVDDALVWFEAAGGLPAARLERARLALRRGDIGEAETLLHGLLEEHPDAIPVWALMVRLALARGDTAGVEAASARFSRTRGRLPNPLDREVNWLVGVDRGLGRRRLLAAGIEAAQAGGLREAEPALRASLAAGWSPEAADTLAAVLSGAGRIDEAVATLTDAVDRAGPDARLLRRLGQAQAARGDARAAVAAWERGLRTENGPIAADISADLAARLRHEGHVAAAQAIEAQGFETAVRAALDAGDPRAAVAASRAAITATPERPHVWFLRGEAFLTAGDTAAARGAFARCLELQPHHGRAALALRVTAADAVAAPGAATDARHTTRPRSSSSE